MRGRGRKRETKKEEEEEEEKELVEEESEVLDLVVTQEFKLQTLFSKRSDIHAVARL